MRTTQKIYPRWTKTVIALVRPAIIVVQQLWKYRKQIYGVVSAQDRYIKSAFVGTRVSKAAQYGWRSGAAAGGLVGGLITNQAEDSPGNAIQKQTKIQPVNTSRTTYKTRGRRPRCYSPRRKF